MLQALVARATGSDSSSAVAVRAGEDAFAAARRLAPADPLILVDLARAELALRHYDEALATARRIVELYPGSATGHALEAAALMSLGRRAEARASLERALAARWNDVDDAPRRAAERLQRALESGSVSP
jgi:tetratricopeptide (TPR) repeat protein